MTQKKASANWRGFLEIRTHSRKTFRTDQAGVTKNLEKRLDYWEKIRDIQPENLVFLDETGINLAMTRTYGRSVKGNRVYDTRPYERGTNLTLIGAISLSGFSGIMTINSGTSKNVFQVFIKQVL
ncbi:MAG: transposase [Microcoleaceae cyanobacterium]